MNSVTPSRTEQKQVENGGAGKGVVLFCCALFFLFQITAIFPPVVSSVVFTQQLIVVPPQSLRLASATEEKDIHPVSLSAASGNYHLAPFFFEPIAINYCDKSLLMSLKGIGPSLAESILTTRNTRGYFKTPGDLLQVKGIGSSRLLQFTPYFDFSVDHATK